jgi:hypothetical protein
VTSASRAVAALLAVLLGAVAPAVRAEDEGDPTAAAAAALVSAAKEKDPARLQKALDAAQAGLVGPSAVFPDVGALADWIGTLPDDVTRLASVRARRAWLYVTAKRGKDALGLLDGVLESDATNGILRAYRGEARRQAGDLPGAVEDLSLALDQGATDDHVLPSVRRIVFDLRRFPPKDAPADALPAYVTVVAPVLRRRDLVDLRMAFVEWLDYDAGKARDDPARAARLRAEAVRQAGAAVRLVPAPEDRVRLARMAYDAGLWRRALPADAAADVPTAFDLLAAAVRLGERTSGEGHEVPEALSALAEEAAARGRYVLADRLARRRLDISDSPTARRVLRGLPPDVGD